MSSSLHAQYILEREGKHIFEDERGFATYLFLPDLRTVYIEDIFVSKEHRTSGVASFYADEISKIAKANGCTKLIGSVSPQARNATTSLKVLLAYGFELDSMDTHLIYFKKNIA